MRGVVGWGCRGVVRLGRGGPQGELGRDAAHAGAGEGGCRVGHLRARKTVSGEEGGGTGGGLLGQEWGWAWAHVGEERERDGRELGRDAG